ncbi:unnamed protein product [Didymodactylos carnosus]|uniref:poly(A)-specific ribonuclease n=1 Tax=Didymodactylos carnosus TaxID=1234261 RepID=A0A813RM57_9BILA|nr:unnamed protein product [Didymodactylos carnosus]CAF0787691.1 unnamed protein product [Didymodactylos carnosus]CAF3567918.1 unnamed protein product [Didymodactylos carnosus]CAF3570046.1 unnamed protein product [Didymodactylos carnosus]
MVNSQAGVLLLLLIALFIVSMFAARPDLCSLESETGICRGAFPRFYYNEETNSCEHFTWGGCGGNENNFENESECEQQQNPYMIKDVWQHNLETEFKDIRKIVLQYPFVAMDTEFPGIVVRPLGEFKTTAEYQYQCLKLNVDFLKIIQLGLTFMNEKGESPPGVSSYQFNFNFNLTMDMYAQDSIELLQKSGIQFKKHEDEGIDPQQFAELLTTSGVVFMDNIVWLSFHSGYDFGYLLKMLTGKLLPDTENEFFELLKLFFPNIYDVKYLMKSCKNLKGGLEEVTKQLEIERIGPQHQAGSDSLMTGLAFFKMKEYGLGPSSFPVVGFAYEGILAGATETENSPMSSSNANFKQLFEQANEAFVDDKYQEALDLYSTSLDQDDKSDASFTSKIVSSRAQCLLKMHKFDGECKKEEALKSFTSGLEIDHEQSTKSQNDTSNQQEQKVATSGAETHVVTPKINVSAKLSSDSDYSLELNLAYPINDERTDFKVSSANIEIKLFKKDAIQWTYLDGQTNPNAPPILMNKPLAQQQQAAPTYPSSSRHRKDWDKLEVELKNEEKDEKLEGDAAVNQLFQQIYRDGSDETRRAMNKSFSESGGTVLSTNWDDIKQKKTELKAPDGMEWKKYDT